MARESKAYHSQSEERADTQHDAVTPCLTERRRNRHGCCEDGDGDGAGMVLWCGVVGTDVYQLRDALDGIGTATAG